jgi:flagellar export protein FliJ
VARFVFRAQAALDLRQKRHDITERSRAAAAMAVARAEQGLAGAHDELRAAVADMPAVAGLGVIEWHRHWIVSRHQDIARHAHALEQRRRELAAAEAQALRARRDLKALERLQERALAAHTAREQHEEQKALDWIGTVGFALRREAGRQEDL